MSVDWRCIGSSFRGTVHTSSILHRCLRLHTCPSLRLHGKRNSCSCNTLSFIPGGAATVQSRCYNQFAYKHAALAKDTPRVQAVATEEVQEELLQPDQLGSHSLPEESEQAILGQVLMCVSLTLPAEVHYAAAVKRLQAAVKQLPTKYQHYSSGMVRLEVPLPRGLTALHWLQGQPQGQGQGDRQSVLQPRLYFSPRQSSAPGTAGAALAEAAVVGAGAVAGAGAAWMWQGMSGQALSPETVQEMSSFLSPAHPRLRVLGGTRFNTNQMPGCEWNDFGSYCFMLPRLEVVEAAGCTLLSCNVAWHDQAAHTHPHHSCASHRNAETGSDSTHCQAQYTSVGDATADALAALAVMRASAVPAAPALQVHRQSTEHFPDQEGWGHLMQPLHDALATSAICTDRLPQLNQVEPDIARAEYETNGQEGLDQLLAALDGGFEGVGTALLEEPSALTKVVLARRSDVKFTGSLDPLSLLHALQERDPRSYQIYLQLGSGACFLGSTPEQLYIRSGQAVASEAVAATRPRGPAGDIEKDFWYALDLLRSPKDHVEFTLVRDFVRDALLEVCSEVKIDTEKSVLKQAAVQHLYGRLSGTLKSAANDAQLLAALHPTPAVCGRPRATAKEILASKEVFDRGFYSGPFGWLSGCAAEFVVAIRSALIHAHPSIALDKSQPSSLQAAGVNGSRVTAGDVHTHTISLFAGVGIVKGSTPEAEWQELELKARQFQLLLQPLPSVAASPNVNLLCARAMVEELCRLGVNTFAVAPGSRSSALTLAVAMHPRARVTTCIDERSLAFWALGHARATGLPAAVITSSGTAVANLLPAVVEASQSNIPMLLITADRPSEMRDSGANQTIDQVKIFGGYTRWAVDLPPPDHIVPVRGLLTTTDAAVRFATGNPAGPVHMNCQFREPLAPAVADWPQALLKGMHQWGKSNGPFTQPIGDGGNSRMLPASPAMSDLLATLGSAQRGLLVVAELTTAEDVTAALTVSKVLGWPLVADALSGLRVGMSEAATRDHVILHHFDQVLLDKAAWPGLKPDVVLQLGNHMVSKRLLHFLEWSALDNEELEPMRWIHADASNKRLDEKYLITQRVQMPLAHLAHLLSQSLGKQQAGAQSWQYKQLLDALNDVAHHEIDAWLSQHHHLSESFVARTISQQLPSGNGLFIGNSMPIRDMDMYATWCQQSHAEASSSYSTASPQQSHTATWQASQGGVQYGVGAPVGSNRGASGIDGVLSTAAGFAAGLKRPTTLLVGDVSFLHDVNGLNLLRTGDMQPPLTVVLVNNGGGGIFSFLPIADSLAPEIFTPLWATPHNVDLAGMCRAQGIAHQKVTRLEELSPALHTAWNLHRHSVVEVITGRDTNVDQHRQLQASVQHAVRHATLLLTQPASGIVLKPTRKQPLSVASATWQCYSIPLQKPVTTGATTKCRQGFIFQLVLEQDNQFFGGVGEVAPLPGLHLEGLQQAEQQLALLCQAVSGLQVPLNLSMMQGRISSWIKDQVGLDPINLYPSVRCGLEGALLTALAHAHRLPLTDLLLRHQSPASQSVGADMPVKTVLVNGLLDSNGNVEACQQEAIHMVAQGFTALKIKVGREQDPVQDAAMVVAVRHAVGPGIALRADANRKWSLNQAVAFGHAVAEADLQYVEEPVQDTRDLGAFFDQTHIPTALDETLDEAVSGKGASSYPLAMTPEAILQHLMSQLPKGSIAALVVKPGVVGGFEKAGGVSQWAAAHNIQVVISSAFESSIGLAQYTCLAHAANQMQVQAEMLRSSLPQNRSQAVPGNAAHGLGTESWFQRSDGPGLLQPVSSTMPTAHLEGSCKEGGGQQQLGICLTAAIDWLTLTCTVHDDMHSAAVGQGLRLAPGSAFQYATQPRHAVHVSDRCVVHNGAGQYHFHISSFCPAQSQAQTPETVSIDPVRTDRHLEAQVTTGGRGHQQFDHGGDYTNRPVCFFLHGFLGDADDWSPIMKALAMTHECIALDLPGHGRTCVHPSGPGSFDFQQTGKAVVAAITALMGENPRDMVLVGYSLGARLALYLTTQFGDSLKTVVSISGSVGVSGATEASARMARDTALAAALETGGLAGFVETWYRQPMWATLRNHPRFVGMLKKRCISSSLAQEAQALEGMSSGNQPYLGQRLFMPGPLLIFVAGSEDTKFVRLANSMAAAASGVDSLQSASHLECTAQQMPSSNIRYTTASGAIVCQVDGCGHAVHIERPEAVLQILTHFLAALDAA